MVLRNIDSQVQEWQTSSAISEDARQAMISLQEFKSLSEINVYLSNDAYGYSYLDDYLNFIASVGELLHPEVMISDISGDEEDDFWEIRFTVDDNPEIISMINPNTEHFQNELLDILNYTLSKHGIQNKLRIVYTTGESDERSCFDVAFMNDENYYKLLDNSPRFAREALM